MRALRSHQRQVANVVRAIAQRQTSVRDILAAVTPGGGKSLLPLLAAVQLKAAGIVDRVCWIVPRDSLRLQAEEAFADPVWRTTLGHAISVRAAENAPDPCRGLDGYVTTFQAVAAAPDLHLSEFRRHRYLLALDELHHLPALADTDSLASADDETAWSRAILPLLECATVRLLMSGTLERADGRGILWLPYKAGRPKAKVRHVDLEAENWAVVGYSRRKALEERAILPVTFGAMDGSAQWADTLEQVHAVESFNEDFTRVRDALHTALRTEFADDLLRRAFDDCRRQRAERRAELGLGPSEVARGLGKLLVVAPDQATARRYMDFLAPRVRGAGGEAAVRIAMSDAANAQEAIAAFRLRPLPSVLITVAMAYEGMDAPEITHCAALTHIRSRPWLEQMIARATRVDPHGGSYDRQRAVVYHPDDLFFREFRHAIETEQGTGAAIRKRRRQGELPLDSGGGRGQLDITPLHSNATTLRFDVMAPGPDLRTGNSPLSAEHHDLFETPSAVEHRLRQRIGQMVATQVIEDQDARLVIRASGYHAYNAVLKRVLGKARADMTLAELEAAAAWLERNRLSDHLDLLEKDHHFTWSAGRRRQDGGRTVRLGPHRVEVPSRNGPKRADS